MLAPSVNQGFRASAAKLFAGSSPPFTSARTVAMTDLSPGLTLEGFRECATEILESIAASRRLNDAEYDTRWAMLWTLLRAGQASGLSIPRVDDGVWAMKSAEVGGPDLRHWLVGENIWLALRMPLEPQPGDAELATDLPRILNGAKVQPPEA
jgi:hypothetical protein